MISYERGAPASVSRIERGSRCEDRVLRFRSLTRNTVNLLAPYPAHSRVSDPYPEYSRAIDPYPENSRAIDPHPECGQGIGRGVGPRQARPSLHAGNALQGYLADKKMHHPY